MGKKGIVYHSSLFLSFLKFSVRLLLSIYKGRFVKINNFKNKPPIIIKKEIKEANDSRE